MVRLLCSPAVTGGGGRNKPINGTIFVVIREAAKGKELCFENRRAEGSRVAAGEERREQMNDVKNDAYSLRT